MTAKRTRSARPTTTIRVTVNTKHLLDALLVHSTAANMSCLVNELAIDRADALVSRYETEHPVTPPKRPERQERYENIIGRLESCRDDDDRQHA